MIKRIKEISKQGYFVAVKYEVEVVDPETEAPRWLPSSVQGHYWQEEDKVDELMALFLKRAELGADPMNCEWQKISWKYPKEGPEVSMVILLNANGVPKPMTLKVEGIAIAEADGTLQFTTPEEARLLAAIASSALRLSKEIFQQQFQQLELLDGGMAA